jgi:pyruvate kinase
MSSSPAPAPVRVPDGARSTTARRTKIVATIGPASEQPDTLAAMVAAGMDVARVPLAHGTIADAVERIRRLRAVAPHVGVLVDLPGPKPRTGPFADGGVELVEGADVKLVSSDGGLASTAEVITADEHVVATLEPGDGVALGDGGVALRVKERRGSDVVATVVSGGEVRGRPGIAVPGRPSTEPSLTPEDRDRLDVLLEVGVDLVAVSFVRSADDVQAVRAVTGPAGPLLVAKIETAEAVSDLDRIAATADAVMVARGDLGVRLPIEDVPHIQKRIIRTGVRYGRPVITATQMLESMLTAASPTRAEVADIANAVLDGTSALMLSGETAIGAHPVGVVATMARIASRAEREFDYRGWGADLAPQEVSGGPGSPAALTAATTAAAWRATRDQQVALIIACTRSGATARAISRFRPDVPIIAATPSAETARQLSLSWGVTALTVGESRSTDDIVWFAVQAVVRAGYASSGDVAVVLAGSPTEPEPATDTLRLVRIR